MITKQEMMDEALNNYLVILLELFGDVSHPEVTSDDITTLNELIDWNQKGKLVFNKIGG